MQQWITMTADDATMNTMDSDFSFLKPLLEDFKFIYILKIIQLRCKFTYGFSTDIPLNILIMYSKDPNFNIQIMPSPTMRWLIDYFIRVPATHLYLSPCDLIILPQISICRHVTELSCPKSLFVTMWPN